VPHTVVAALAGLDCDNFSAIPPVLAFLFQRETQFEMFDYLGESTNLGIFRAQKPSSVAALNAYRVGAGNFLAEIVALGRNLHQHNI
jgi:hypothetical protein